MPADFFIFLAIFAFAFFAQAVVGFGGNILALTLGALLFPVPQLLTWLVPMVILLSGYILIRHHQHVAWPLLLKQVLPWMAGGLVIGQILFYVVDTTVLKKMLGAMVIALALKELLLKSDGGRRRLPPWTFGAGVCHGLFAAGGPLLVYGIAGQSLNKSAFRSTLAVVWLGFGLVLMTSYLIAGQVQSDALPRIGIMALVLPMSIALGEWVHHRVSEGPFKILIYLLLIIAGAALLIR